MNVQLNHSIPQLRAFVEQKYRECYNAEIVCDYERLMVVADADGNTLAVAGMRPANDALFLEHYLEKPVEQCVADVFNVDVARQSIVEIGNLVANNARAGFALMQSIWAYHEKQGYDYVVFTSTASLLRRFKLLPVYELAWASAGLVAGGERWGSYYQKQPCVVVGHLSAYDQRFLRCSRPQEFSIHVLEDATCNSTAIARVGHKPLFKTVEGRR